MSVEQNGLSSEVDLKSSRVDGEKGCDPWKKRKERQPGEGGAVKERIKDEMVKLESSSGRDAGFNDNRPGNENIPSDTSLNKAREDADDDGCANGGSKTLCDSKIKGSDSDETVGETNGTGDKDSQGGVPKGRSNDNYEQVQASTAEKSNRNEEAHSTDVSLVRNRSAAVNTGDTIRKTEDSDRPSGRERPSRPGDGDAERSRIPQGQYYRGEAYGRERRYDVGYGYMDYPERRCYDYYGGGRWGRASYPGMYDDRRFFRYSRRATPSWDERYDERFGHAYEDEKIGYRMGRWDDRMQDIDHDPMAKRAYGDQRWGGNTQPGSSYDSVERREMGVDSTTLKRGRYEDFNPRKRGMIGEGRKREVYSETSGFGNNKVYVGRGGPEDNKRLGDRIGNFTRFRKQIPLNPPPSKVLGLFGLSSYATIDDIKEFLSEKLPKIRYEHVHLVKDRVTGQSRGFGFVYFNSLEDAITAKEELQGQEVYGKLIRVDYSISEINSERGDAQ